MISPFKFLDSYTKEDREIFFGREREIEELYHRVFESKIMLVYGVSGTGKSSLIHCGLANKFDETDWLPLVIRRGGNILDSLASSIKSAAITQQPGEITTPAQFRKAVRSLYLDHYKPVFFIFDQFEELFIFGSKDEKKAAVQVIKALVESDIQCRFIFVMREEYMAGITEFERYIPSIFQNRVRIEKMSHANAIEAIKGPCKVAGIKLEEGFAEALLEKLSPESADVELTYLQVFLDRILRLAGSQEEGHSFTNSMLSKAGNVSDLLGSFLEEQISLLDNPDTGLALLKSFVSVKGTKKQMSADEVSEYTRILAKPIMGTAMQELLQLFVNRRILCEKDQNDKYELRHDALAGKIYEKISIVEKEIIEIRQFIENAYANFEKRKIFLGSEDLNYIAPYYDKLFLNKKLAEFIENSRKHISQKKRAFNRTLIYSAVGFLFIILSVVIYYSRSNIRAKSNELAIEAFLQRDFSSPLSLETAIKAYRKDTTSTIAIKAIFNAFYSMLENGTFHDSLGNEINPGKEIFSFTPCKSNIRYADFSLDGKFIFGYSEDGTIQIWTIKGESIFSIQEKTGPIASLCLSSDNKYIGAIYFDSTAIIWNSEGDKILESGVVFDPMNPLDVMNFSPIGNRVLLLKGNNNITLFDLEDSSFYELKGHTNEINAAVFSPDGKFISSASKDSTIIIWEMNKSSFQYQKTTQIGGFKGSVWSVDFASNSKYLLTIEEPDSQMLSTYYWQVKVQNLLGEAVFSIYFPGDSAWIANEPRTYRGKYFSAHFTGHDAAITLASFRDQVLDRSYQIDRRIDRSAGYDYYRIRFAPTSMFNLFQQDKSLNNYGINSKKEVIGEKVTYNYSYSFIDASRRYIAINKTGEEYSVLFLYNRLPVLRFKGTQPRFSPSGNYLLCIEGSLIKLLPADEKELITLYEDKQLFGKVEADPRKWKHFFLDW